MRELSGSDIRREFNKIQEALAQMDEKFVKADDPSLSVINFIERVSNSLAVVKNLYSKEAGDRNKIIGPVLQQANNIAMACNDIKISLQKIGSGQEDPEDTNKTVEA